MRLTSKIRKLIQSVIPVGVGSSGQFRDKRCNQLHCNYWRDLLSGCGGTSYF